MKKPDKRDFEMFKPKKLTELYSVEEIKKIKEMDNETLIRNEINRLEELKKLDFLHEKGIDIIACDKSLFCVKYRTNTIKRNYFVDGIQRINGPGVYLNFECNEECPLFKHYGINCMFIDDRHKMIEEIKAAIENQNDLFLKNIIDREITFLRSVQDEQNN